MSKGLKILLILLIVVVFGAIAYFLLAGESATPVVATTSTGSPSTSPTATPTQNSAPVNTGSGSGLQTSTGQPVSGLAVQSNPEIDADQIGQEFLSQLLNIRSIKLREDIFSSPGFISLVDFTIELIQLGNEGRINPFAPFDAESVTGDPLLDQGAFIDENGQPITTFGQGTVTPTNTTGIQTNGNNQTPQNGPTGPTIGNVLDVSNS